MVNKKELSTQCRDFLLDYKPRTPEFYMLPKIHKPQRPPPGRPIISGNDSPTERISQLVDHFLQPCVPTLPSYVKDSSHFLQILQTYTTNPLPDDALLCTLDVSSLYTNIPHQEGMRACAEALRNQKNTDPMSVQSIITLLRLILTLNNFQFNGTNYIQIAGTAMGTRMAPCYANIFMGWFENQFVYTFPQQPLIWCRYIDDIFLIWTHGMDNLQEFISHLNTCHPTIKFTSEISETHVPFLDILISKNQNHINTDLYCKPTDTHNYLLFTSCHPWTCKNAIPYSQFLKIRRICNDESTFIKRAQQMAAHFFRRGYDHDNIHTSIIKAWRTDRDSLLQPQTTNSTDTDNPLLLITTYNPNLNPITSIVDNNWDLLCRNSSTRWLYDKHFKKGLRRLPNLRDMLVNAKLQNKAPITKPISRPDLCNNPNCRFCPRINRSGNIISPFDHQSWYSKIHVNCTSHNLVYAIQCTRCQSLYVGQTSNNIKTRYNNHFYDINKKPNTDIITY